MKFEWVLIDLIEDGKYFWETTHAAKTYGGWIVRTVRETTIDPEGNIFQDKSRTTESAVFVPDPNHEWDIKEYEG